ncbi:MAG: S-adenosylmethionine-diacylglycerol 3-amino-3-carboxypropyl transferase [Myxococcota bacterium]
MSDATVTLAKRLNYAQCWEDTRILLEATRPKEGECVLSIASAGDNAIALAMTGAQVDAVDVSEPQLALVALKLSGHHLSYGDFRGLMGLQTGVDALRAYRLVREHLPEFALRYWDDNEDMLLAGVLSQGRFERYLSMFGQRILPAIHRNKTTMRWFELESVDDRRRYWKRWNNLRWRALFRVFFSQRVMAARGRSPEQFQHVNGGIGGALMARTQRVLTELDPRDNGYLQWILTGAYLRPECEPAYLRPEGHAQLGEVSGRIELVHTDLTSHMKTKADGHYSAFNLSDVPEYLDLGTTEELLAECARTGRSGARIAYWNLFVPRCRPASLADQIDRHPDIGLALYAQDRSFFYGAFQVEEVR